MIYVVIKSRVKGQQTFEQQKLVQYAERQINLHSSQADQLYQYLQSAYKLSKKLLGDQHQGTISFLVFLTFTRTNECIASTLSKFNAIS